MRREKKLPIKKDSNASKTLSFHPCGKMCKYAKKQRIFTGNGPRYKRAETIFVSCGLE
jgi:hypothetical protein